MNTDKIVLAILAFLIMIVGIAIYLIPALIMDRKKYPRDWLFYIILVVADLIPTADEYQFIGYLSLFVTWAALMVAAIAYKKETAIVYLAAPYSHPYQSVKNQRFLIINQVAAQLMREGNIVFSPISHAHQIAVDHSLPTDWEYWQRSCEAFVSVSKKVVVIKFTG
jgi:hypothetical protein